MAHDVSRQRSAQLQATGLTVVRGGRRVLDDIDFVVGPGERIGLIGANGAGKSTLLAALAGQLEPDAGLVRSPATIGLLGQELAPAAHVRIGEVIDDAVAPVRAIGDRLEAAALQLADDEDAAREYERALAEAEQRGLWQLDARIESVLAGVGLGGFARDRPIAELSGGQRRRLALAALLLEAPVALLLDEPTNHLDDSARAFVSNELRSWSGPVLFASHDRAFLDEVATGIVDLDPKVGPHGARDGVRQGARSSGGFSAYLRQRAGELEQWRAAFAQEQLERARLQRVIDIEARDIFHTTEPRGEAGVAKKFEADRAAKTVGARLRQARAQLAALDRSPVAPPPEPLRFRGFAHRERGGEVPLAVVADAAVAGRMQPVSLEIARQDRILIEGPNGAGKSTLLALLAGQLDADAGSVKRVGTVGLLAQYDSWPDLAMTAANAYRAALRRPDAAPSLSELGLLDAEASAKPLRELSYGQRRRVALASLVAEPPALLLLDEPTNHLALALAEELERVLPQYPRAVVIASHDVWLRSRWAGRRILLEPLTASE
ncbi:ABC transporter ATP-binding protein [Gulosibacter macacae]|uniref:ABC transporter ATP-binding protein n=1 Tax=Gulosibacter macacae TaxID=2488791 RepID=A0A3P3VYP2_9MICO|nr:ABC-F family ATP-binding cassette domain-containing protein [Gulosibacter macacae]RRJ87931.1 ABC transporter ATP-binding protein [Gulosibacter macacae]